MPQFDFDKNYIKYVIFDMDGVLINSEPIAKKATIIAMSEIGIDANSCDFKAFIGAGEDKLIISACQKHNKEDMIPVVTKRFYELFSELVLESEIVYPSAHKLIEELKNRGFHLCIASSSESARVTGSLKAAKIDESLFDAIITGSDVSEKKPSPEIYFTAMDALDADPEECLIIEDALNGVRAAKLADAFCFAVTTSFQREELEKENPDFISDDIINVLDIL